MANLGHFVAGWVTVARPDAPVLAGQFARLERFDLAHASALFAAFYGHDALWDYMAYGPFSSAATYYRWAKDAALGNDPLFYTIRDVETGHLGGVAAYLNIVPAHGTLEIGHICLSPALSGTRAGSEALALMITAAFEAGYRRVEWKCNALNIPSRRAAQRLGFSFEGVFRNHLIIKGRNRDTAWFALTDEDWPKLREAFAIWFNPRNFDTAGQQKQRLSDLTRLVCATFDPALAV